MASWPDVILALIAAVPATIAAVFAGFAASHTKTANGTKLADVVTQTHDVVQANADRLERVGNGVSTLADKGRP